MSPALTIQGLSKQLGAFSLRDVHLSVERGTITGLVGANGAGKSTLLKLVMGLLSPDAGTLHVFGESLREQGPRLRARMGYVQETPTLPGQLRAVELGRFVAPFFPTWEDAAYQRLLQGFETPMKTPFKQLSQGNRMKVSLALALAHRPELLILDEPTSGLDPLARREFLDLLLEVVQDEGRAVFFSTHITSDLDRVADHVAFLKEGQLALAGAKEELLEAWVLVKGGEELAGIPARVPAAGGRRTALGIELLCRAEAADWPAEAVVERPRIEDLIYFFGRPLESLAGQEA